MAAVKLVPITLWLRAYKVVREECVITLATVKSARPRRADNAIWMSQAECIQGTRCACEQDTDSENSFNASMLLDLCMMRFQSVCLWAKTGWLRERLQPRRRCINSGVMEADSIHTHTQSPPPFKSLPSNEAGPEAGPHSCCATASFQQPQLNMFYGSLVCTFWLWKKKKKSIYFPVHSLSDLHIFPSITGEYFKSKQATKRWFRRLPSHNSAGVNE